MMPVVDIKSPKDLKKLIGFKIKNAGMVQNTIDGALVILLEHEEAPAPFWLVVQSGVRLGRNGNILIANGALNATTKNESEVVMQEG